MSPETNTEQAPIVEENKIINTEETAQETPESIQETNWKKFREQREIERKQREAAEKRAQEKEEEARVLKEAMETLLNKPSRDTRERQNDYSDDDLTEDERIHKKVEAALAIREKQYQEMQKQREIQEYPQRLNNEYRDFNQVCSADNLDYLEFHYPEVASAFKHVPDGYDKWSSIYKAVKRFVPNVDSRKEQKRAENNFNKPQSMASPGATQTGDTAPVHMDDQRRAANWARMQKIMKGA